MAFTTEQRWLFLVRAGVSALILLTGLFIVLSGIYSDARAEWACGLVGLVIGYWLR